MFTPPPQLDLDSYVARLSVLQPWTLCAVNEVGEVVPSITYDAQSLRNLMMRAVTVRHMLAFDVDVVSGEVMHHGRLVSQARLVWTVREREFKVWKSHRAMELRKAYADLEQKPPSKELIQDTYRVHPDYGAMARLVEQAEEVHNNQEIVYHAFRAKLAVLTRDVVRTPDGRLERLST